MTSAPTFVHNLPDADLTFHKRLIGKIVLASQGVDAAHAALSKANMAQASASAAMETWMEELAVRYNLKPLDAIDQNGQIHYVDPGWRQELASETADSSETQQSPRRPKKG